MTKRSTQRGNLPADATAFVGRRHLLDTVGPILSRARLVMLLGGGGVGKTRAAIHLGRTYPRATPGGVWLVDLSTVDQPELVPRAVADVLGIHDQSQRPALDTVVAHVRERGHLLLILDNCEHLTTAVAELADALLRRCPSAHILATSRTPLGVSGEYTVRVRPMSLPTCAELTTCTTLDAIAHHDSVHLFLDRAAEAGSVVSDQDAVTVGKLVRAVEGVPLAIELAAARTATMTVTDVLNRLDDPLRVLTGTSGIAHPRHHRALDTTLSWSYQLCTPAEQRLWARLSVFTGGFDLTAAETVCSDDLISAAEIQTVIDGLVRQSLVTVHQTGTGATSHVRYRILETVRAYGRARLAEHREDAEARRRHRTYYRALTTKLLRHWYGPDELDWITRVRREMPNIRAALSSSVADRDTDTGLIITVNLSRSRVWFLVGTLPEARYWLRTLIAQHADTGLRLLVMANGAWIAACQGDKCSALSIIADCLRAARAPDPAIEDLSATMVAFARGAYQLFCGNNFTGAANSFSRARDGLLRYGLFGDAHMARLLLAIAAAAGTDPGTAFSAAEDCVTDAETAGARWAASWAQWAHGLAHLRHGDPHRALILFRAGLRTQHATADNWGPAWSLAALGWTAAALGDHEHAALLMGAANRQFQRIGIDTNRLTLLATLGETAEATAGTTLGNPTYSAAHKRGTRLDYKAAVTAALAEDTPPPPATTKERPRGAVSGNSAETAQLTERQQEVAFMLGANPGLTNKDLAAELFVTVRTVEAHMNHIMRKLGVTSRTQIAVWAITHTPQTR
ncbi:MAG TPA: LuxR C-terminal-related transcriptional regulator [Pseudonocardiaceae bacterium]|jgi:predicted ATPase/DNA-binding CsgD family transcriptional regulator|nr:LuxR C-terminal-related transcriptional regulator [Pseudonocardiaceae bacterium]